MRPALKALLAAALATALLAPAPASAQFGIEDLGVGFHRAPPEGAEPPALGPAEVQAGAHPYALRVAFEVASHPSGEGGLLVDEAVRDLEVRTPDGFTGSPTAVPTCSGAEFLTGVLVDSLNVPSCPDSTAVGRVANELSSRLGSGALHSPVYNLDPPPGVALKLGFWTSEVPVTIEARVSEESPNAVIAGPTDISQVIAVIGSELILWGVPADPRHDPERGHCLDSLGESLDDCEAGVSEEPFLTMPRSCEGPLITRWEARSWQGSTDSGQAESEAMTGCGSLTLAPELSARPTARAGASASGLEVSLGLTDEGLTNPTGTAGSDIEAARFTLPEGMTINPSQAEGLETCSRSEIADETAGSSFGAGCPPASKIGTVEAETPLLEDETLRGAVFVAEPYENPFDSLIALYLTLKSPARGIAVTLAGKVEPHPETGQLITSFGSDGQVLPSQPFSEFRVRLREGSRSPLVTPRRCGSYESEMLLTPSADPSRTVPETSGFQITGGPAGAPCPPAGAPPFAPGFAAGTLSNGAGTTSPFLMRLTRRDGDQDLTRFSAVLPPGVLASLAGVGRCSEAQIAAARARTGAEGGREELHDPSCPPSSLIGHTLAGAGVGSQLVHVPGFLYLAGPYRGAPLSVVAIVPGVAGPFDVGAIVVRVALGFDPLSAEAFVDGLRSDAIPHILKGIPLAVRDVRVHADRPGWVLNPTSCRLSSTRATIFGSFADAFDPADDVPVGRIAPFRAADCEKLGFRPRLGLRLKGGTRRGGHPALRATYVPRPGHANLRRLALTFPRSAFVENANFRTICTRVQFAADACPKGSAYGFARAWTPLLDEPLQGPVYLRSSNNLLPDAIFDLRGIIDVEVAVRIDSVKGRLRATVQDAPDAPVSRVVVQMQGGRKGLFVNSRGLCRGPNRGRANLIAQSAKRALLRPRFRAAGCKKRRGRASVSAARRAG